ncbi:MAG: hypothetical protein ACXWWC_03570 [Chitinophagaceae bacterium]
MKSFLFILYFLYAQETMAQKDVVVEKNQRLLFQLPKMHPTKKQSWFWRLI